MQHKSLIGTYHSYKSPHCNNNISTIFGRIFERVVEERTKREIGAVRRPYDYKRDTVWTRRAPHWLFPITGSSTDPGRQGVYWNMKPVVLNHDKSERVDQWRKWSFIQKLIHIPPQFAPVSLSILKFVPPDNLRSEITKRR